VRKIISILVTLGIVLGLTLVAAPAAAQVDCPADCTPIYIDDIITVGPPDFCAGMKSDYQLGDAWLLFPFGATILLPVSLVAGADWLSVDFPADTDLSDVGFGDVWVWSTWAGAWGMATEIVIIDQHLEFRVPAAFLPVLPQFDVITIEVYDVTNPTVPGDYCLYVDYKFDCCDPVQFDCVEYTVVPAIKEYGFHFDFGKTFGGIAEDFIPPFKACGQEEYGFYEPGIGWLDIFDLILRDENLGCLPPCGNATMWFVLEECEPGGDVWFVWDQLGVDWWYFLDETVVGIEWPLPDVDLTVWPPPDVEWECKLHFSIPGEYKICFYLECPAVYCGAGSQMIAIGCLPVKVYQWKDPFKIELDPKWNLISLPLFPFNTEITSVLASMDRPDQLMSVWYFDQCDDPDPQVGKWYTDPGDGTGDLDDIEAGKSYWFRMRHPGDLGYDPGAFPVSLWVFGHHAPMPPADPMAVFDVCEGFNMVGYKAPWDYIPGPDLTPQQEWDDLYLWNWLDLFGGPEYGVIYSWDSTVQDWLWSYPYNELMTPGVGYWIPFSHDGEIYPKP